jgi:hypothetical protein
MLDPEAVNQRGAASEAAIKEQFEKLGYAVKKLDRNAKRPRPDCLISNSAGRPEMLCEVKTVNSAGYLRDRGAHISMLDEKLYDTGVFENQIDLTKISDNLDDAVRKRSALITDEPEYADLPLLVAFSFDFYADYLVCYPRSFDAEVSGILTIKKDIAQTKAFGQLSDDEQEQRLRSRDMSGLPASSQDFVLIRNKAARRGVPKDFQDQCFTEGYDESE